MNNPLCNRLDDYLADSLNMSQRIEFEAHLTDCEACRIRLAFQRHIDRLLVRGAEADEPVPASLIAAIEKRLELRRRRMTRLIWSASAAAAIVLLFTVDYLRKHPLVRIDTRPIVQDHNDLTNSEDDVGSPAHMARSRETLVRVTLTDPSAAILIPHETEAPNVTVVWIHPTR
jgi:hypothetical protein